MTVRASAPDGSRHPCRGQLTPPAARCAIAAVLACALVACPTAPTAPEPRFPAGFVDAVLDKEPDVAAAEVRRTWPASREVPGGFQRFAVDGSEVLEEVILFRSVRTGRVDSVILKYRADLGPRDRVAILTQAGHPQLANVDEIREVPWRRGMTLRLTPSDRFGRLTLTVEP